MLVDPVETHRLGMVDDQTQQSMSAGQVPDEFALLDSQAVGYEFPESAITTMAGIGEHTERAILRTHERCGCNDDSLQHAVQRQVAGKRYYSFKKVSEAVLGVEDLTDPLEDLREEIVEPGSGLRIHVNGRIAVVGHSDALPTRPEPRPDLGRKQGNTISPGGIRIARNDAANVSPTRTRTPIVRRALTHRTRRRRPSPASTTSRPWAM